ncbi:MAG: hypothetical protein WC521_08355 [Bdellovibrionales bacterium]
MYSLTLSDQIFTVVGLVEAIALLPILLEFLIERRKRRHAVDLSLEILDVAEMEVHLAGVGDLVTDISDLIDRARHPEAYAELRLGNEILIAGPPLSGKKALAKRIAIEASFDRIIIVHNPRNVDALARAKHLATHNKRKKTMLLLPRLDLINEREDEELLTELDGVIEATSELSNTLVVGTTSKLIVGSEVDNLFGVTLALPGAPIVQEPVQPLRSDVHRMLGDVAEFYLDRTMREGYQLKDISRDGVIARILINATNPAQIEDVIVLCQTSSIFRQRKGEKGTERVITPDMLELAMRRVIMSS